MGGSLVTQDMLSVQTCGRKKAAGKTHHDGVDPTPSLRGTVLSCASTIGRTCPPPFAAHTGKKLPLHQRLAGAALHLAYGQLLRLCS
jgi:hypothetical protein